VVPVGRYVNLTNFEPHDMRDRWADNLQSSCAINNALEVGYFVIYSGLPYSVLRPSKNLLT